jgi:ornithine cyclodeaminase
VSAGTHVTTVGPKSQHAHETPIELLRAAVVVTCDAPAQASAYPEPFFTGRTPLVSLADVILGCAVSRQSDDDITVHCSVGLPGSEVLLAHRLLTGAIPVGDHSSPPPG